MDYTLLYYALAGLIGGIIYVLMPPMITDWKGIVQHLVLGAIMGGLQFLGISNFAAPALNSNLTYGAVVFVGYWAIDGLKALINKFKPSPDIVPVVGTPV